MIQSTDKAKPVTAVIREAKPADIEGMIKCHIAAFPGQFMTEMGPAWLRALYERCLSDEEGINVVAVDASDRILGLAVGGAPRILNDFVKTAKWRFAHRIVLKVFTSGLVRKRVLPHVRSLFRSRRSSGADGEGARAIINKMENRTGFFSICVLPEVKGTGVADDLLEGYQKAVGDHGYAFVYLTVRTNNTRAISYYKKHGWYYLGDKGESTMFGYDTYRATGTERS